MGDSLRTAGAGTRHTPCGRREGPRRSGRARRRVSTGPPGGADDRARTGDLNLGKVALYQLSYVRLQPARPELRGCGVDDSGRRAGVRNPANTAVRVAVRAWPAA